MGRTFDALRAAEAKRDRGRVAAGHMDVVIAEYGSLTHRGGPRRGRVHGFTSGDVVMIGRGRHNDVNFDLFEDATVSASHAAWR